jgi:hypothetical protein
MMRKSNNAWWLPNIQENTKLVIALNLYMIFMLLATTMAVWEEVTTQHMPRMEVNGTISTIAQFESAVREV